MRASLLTPWLIGGGKWFESSDEVWFVCEFPLGVAFPQSAGAKRVRFRVYSARIRGARAICLSRGGVTLASKRLGSFDSRTYEALLDLLPAKLRDRMTSGKPLWISVEVKK